MIPFPIHASSCVLFYPNRFPRALLDIHHAAEADESVRACSRFRLVDLQEATHGFNESNVVGEGGASGRHASKVTCVVPVVKRVQELCHL